MSRLFEVTSIRQMKLANRFVRSATYEGMAAGDGACTVPLIDKMAELAAGGVGLIITSHAFVSPEGRARPRQLGIHSDAMIPALRTMTDAVHAGGGRIVIQLAHAGAQADPALTGLDALGPSSFGKEDGTAVRQMGPADLSRIAEAFGEAARRAKAAGFDGVQVHAAHGYLLSQFLSPHFNKRRDAYGGVLENRVRFLLEVAAKIRATVGEELAVLVKINSDDFIEEGFRPAEMIQTSRRLETVGVDAIEISGGTGLSGDKIPSRIGVPKGEDEEVYYREAARDLKRVVKIPLILVGGIRSLPVAESLVAEGLTDYVALSRPLIREPDLVRRWRSTDFSGATCISCNRCYRPILRGDGISCEAVDRLSTGK
jgi:2,4-dienoyl-CoA reductase-like NADH-dependent reductase (Old Yellow Enzyme family)